MKKLTISLLLAVMLLAILVTPSLAGKTNFQSLDYNGDGIPDCQYQVLEKHNNGGWTINVVYFSLSWEYLGQELWTSYWGIMKDTFEPWTYSFPVS